MTSVPFLRLLLQHAGVGDINETVFLDFANIIVFIVEQAL